MKNLKINWKKIIGILPHVRKGYWIPVNSVVYQYIISEYPEYLKNDDKVIYFSENTLDDKTMCKKY